MYLIFYATVVYHGYSNKIYYLDNRLDSEGITFYWSTFSNYIR